MEPGPLAGFSATLTLSIWVSVAAWAAVMAGRLRGRECRGAWLLWAAGCAAYGLHLAAAFAGPYRWSHAVAWAETARRTRELTGVDAGAGLWLNYLFGLVWLGDLAGWRIRGAPLPGGRWRPAALGLHGFLAFMIFQGTVVFGAGPSRWFGVGVFAYLATSLLRGKLRPPPDL